MQANGCIDRTRRDDWRIMNVGRVEGRAAATSVRGEAQPSAEENPE
jgi:hypothetical protein